MDEQLLKMSGASAGTIAIVIIVYKILKSVLGKKIISNCCGKKMEVGIDVQPSTPNNIQPIIEYAQENPYHQGSSSRPGEKRGGGTGGKNSIRVQEEGSTRKEESSSASSDSTGTDSVNVTISEHL